jgi:iron complex outermembrane receptor protein
MAALLVLRASGVNVEGASFREELTVTASRLAEGGVARHVLVLTREDIAALPVSTLPELLAYLVGGGVARRGAGGIQTDAALRGGTFEQVAVLVDGVRVNDPQTGHFHLQLPLPLEVIERVEVLLGPGSAVHGPDAFGGVVAVTTAAPTGVAATVRAGEHRLREGRAAGPFGGGAWLAAEASDSAGFAPNTDWGRLRGALGWEGQWDSWRSRVNLGVEEADFGARGFYSSRFPEQYEETDTALLTASASRPLGSLHLSLRAAARQHRDHFVLDRSRPSWYANRHRSRLGVLQATLQGGETGTGWLVGIEGSGETLRSTRLGEHQRRRAAAFAELHHRRGRLALSGQLRADHLTAIGWHLSPGASLQVDLDGGWSAGAAAGHSFRLPSFTELHYDSPNIVGNPQLRPERGWTGEVLLRHQGRRVRVEGAAFRRRATDLIDYLRDQDEVYRASNHARVVTSGGELAVVATRVGPFTQVRAAASVLSSRLDADPQRSRYALAHPLAEASLSALAPLPGRWRLAGGVRWRHPRGGEPYTLLDLRLLRPLRRGLGLELEASNLLNRSYQEVPGVPLPPRWATLALSWRSDAAP